MKENISEKKINLNMLHKIQIELALEVKRICEKYSIPFFLVDGSALGAFYIKDFLPWDDDLDIGMYYPDYLRFLEACKWDLNSRYQMKDFTTDSSFGCSFGQMIDTTVELIQENNLDTNDIKGVFIDIHPFSNCSENKVVRFFDYYRFKFYKLCLLYRRNYINTDSKVITLLWLTNIILPEEYIVKRMMKIRNQKRGTKALKIHGRHPEDYIEIANLANLISVDFSKQKFFIQPDCKRMLDSVYGKFNINRREINRHNIIYIGERKEKQYKLKEQYDE